MNRVVVQLRRRDFLRPLFQHTWRHYLWLAVFVICATMMAIQDPRPGSPLGLEIFAIALTAALFTLAAILFAYLLALVSFLWRVRREPQLLGEYLYEIVDDGLRESRSDSEVRVAWGSARRLARTRAHQLIWVTAREWMVIPRRAFANPIADADFWKALQPLAPQKKS